MITSVSSVSVVTGGNAALMKSEVLAGIMRHG
jgi:hypothetical protein